MPFCISLSHAAWSLNARSASWMQFNSATPEYALNLKLVPLADVGSHGSIVPSNPPVARTIGTVP